MKVVLVVPSLSEPGGAEYVVFEWARYLAKAGDRATVYTTHPEGQEVSPEGVSLVRGRKGGVLAKTRGLARHLENEGADVVLAAMPYCNLISITAVRSLGRQRPKVVISEHTLANGPRLVHTGSLAQQRWLARRTYRYADLVVAVSHPVGAEAIAEYRLSSERVAIVPNPAFAKLQDLVTARMTDSAVDPTRLDIVFAGRPVPPMRLCIAVDVAGALAHAFPGGVTVHFFGTGPLFDAIISRARDAGVDVVMHGWVQNWFDDCPAGSIVLLTSVLEGFGNVLVEAAAAGFKSVVSPRCIGSADAVVPGITGELIAGDSVDEYAAALLTMSREPVRDIDPWLRRFSFKSSGEVLRGALVRTAGVIERADP